MKKKLYYIVIKIFALLLRNLEIGIYKKKIYPGFWITDGEIDNLKDHSLVFDFSNETFTHIGDQIFFIYAILQISKNSKIYVVNNGFCKTLWDRLGLGINEKDIDFSYSVFVAGYQYLADSKKTLFTSNLCKRIVLNDFNDHSIKGELGLHILSFFEKYINFKSSLVSTEFLRLPNTDFSFIKSKFFVFNETIYSGFFRKIFIKDYLLASFLEKIKSLDVKLVLIGANDEVISEQHSKFIDYDIRGKLNILDIFSIFQSNNCLGYVGYDNAIMHIACFSEVRSFILFRGRFLKKNIDFHFRSINNALCKNGKGEIIYLDSPKKYLNIKLNEVINK